ncbi:MAG: exosome complex protein Rrp42 [Candidatus Aenigmarchaeota archaeon]|nr:exosome complex protein Rrp42 [Candidatus Aenigmarchaeota archaeon]
MMIIEEDMVKEVIIKEGRRIDDRGFKDYREIKIEKGIVKNAEGSSLVEIGGTKVIAGVKLEPGDPFPDMPNEGVLVVNAEFVPFSFPEVLPGPPDENAIELARVIDRIIRESKSIELEKLQIPNTKKVWKVAIDVIVLDNDGNMKDAAILASIAALLDARFPSYKIESEEEIKVDYATKTEERLPIQRIPFGVTIAKITGKLMIDPNLIEEEAAEAILTVGGFEENSKLFLCALQKAGNKGFTYDEIVQAIDIGLEIGKSLVKILK